MGGNLKLHIDGQEISSDGWYIKDHTDLERKNQDLFALLTHLRVAQNIWDTPQRVSSTMTYGVESEFLSGSSRYLILYPYSILRMACKTHFGDIDLMVDISRRELIEYKLESIIGRLLCGCWSLIGTKRSTNQLITIWYYRGTRIQIDFEFVDFENGYPSTWARFSHFSAMDDTDVDPCISGVFHKLLLRACCATSVDTRIVDGKEVTDSMYAFSVTHGLRCKYLMRTDNPMEFTKLKPKDSTYIKDPDMICMILCGVELSGLYRIVRYNASMSSFVGLSSEMKICRTKSDLLIILRGFMRILFGEGNQKLSSDPIIDYNKKYVATNELINRFGLRTPEIEEEFLDIYKSYKEGIIS